MTEDNARRNPRGLYVLLIRCTGTFPEKIMIYKPPKRAADGMSKSSNSFPTADESDSGTVVGELRSPITPTTISGITKRLDLVKNVKETPMPSKKRGIQKKNNGASASSINECYLFLHINISSLSISAVPHFCNNYLRHA